MNFTSYGGAAGRSPHRPTETHHRHYRAACRLPCCRELDRRRWTRSRTPALRARPRCDPGTLTPFRVRVFLSIARRPPLKLPIRVPAERLRPSLTRCLLYSPASVHARRRGGQEEAVLRPPARLDAQAHAALLLELVELQLAAAIRAWVATQSASGKWCGRKPSAFGAFGRQQGRGPLRGPMRAALCSEAQWGPEGRRAQAPRAQGASDGRCRRCQGDELLERAAGARSDEHRVPRDRLLE